MSLELLLNNQPHTFTTDDLPALIHGEKHSGVSLFSLTLLAQLYFQGEPILIISSDRDIKDKFIELIKESKDVAEIRSEQDIQPDKQVLFLANKQQILLPTAIQSLEDFSERVILITKFEGFSKETVALFYGHSKTIYVGDLNVSDAKEPLLQLKYMAKIFFSPLHNDFRLTLPELEKYHGYYQGRTATGTVRLEESRAN